MKLTFARVSTAVLLWILAVSAFAGEHIVSVRNDTGVWASDLHVTFQNSGGNVFVSPASVVALLCPQPVVPSNGQITNTVVIDWGVACVPPGAVVHFVVRTNFGPLVFNSGNWSGPGNINIGAVNPNGIRMRIPPNPPPPPPPPNWGFWAIKIQVRCLANAPIVKGPWMRPPGASCWMREICEPFVRYETRLVRCWFVFRKWRIIETGRCAILTDWEFSHNTEAKYYDEFATIRPHDMGPEIIPINGAPRNGRIVRGGRFMPWMQGLNVRYSDDSGQSYRQGSDFITAFFDVFASLNRVNNVPGTYNSFATHCQYIAPGYQSAATKLNDVIHEMQLVINSEPDTQVPAIKAATEFLRSSFFDIFIDLSDGTPSDPLAYDRAAMGLTNMAVAFSVTPEPRFVRVVERLNYMAQGFQKARDMVLAGIGDIQNQDDFMFGMINRVANTGQHIANAFTPHLTIQCDLGQIGWFPQVIEGVEVLVQKADTLETLDHMIVPMSEKSQFDIPLLAYEEGIALRIAYKVDTYLSESIVVPATDGFFVNGPPLRNGDVNGDDCVDLSDLSLVSSAQGTGGMDATSIGPEDLNFDGVVDLGDLTLLLNSNGQMGFGFKEIRGTVQLADFDGSAANESVVVELRVPGDPIAIETQELLLDGGGNFTFVTSQPLGTYDLTVQGRTWLRSKIQFLPITGCGADIPVVTLINGDCDRDNEITLVDFGYIAAAFGKSVGEAGYNVSADLNGDGEVTLVDVGVLSAHFGESGAE